ncbi:MAG: class I SAM-dependent methyltransferase [Muribaculum sp.]|nr:class I SAM-dependent methyltransferase [Muribaculum sp.]
MAETYSDFAGIYDELMDNVPYERWCGTVAALIEKYGVSQPVRGEAFMGGAFVGAAPVREVPVPETVERDTSTDTAEGERDALASERDLVVDLGCGTGTLTELLYQKGYDMIGVDNAPSMLNVAMEKRVESGSEILYLLQDMRELELYSTVGTVVSVCDSLNYILEEEELLQVFRLVNTYLYPGGVFIFDFNTDYKYREIIGDTVIAENREDCSFIWENSYDGERCLNEYDLTVFVQEDGELFRRFTETHIQRGYRVEQMKGLVQRAGMRIVEVLDADTLGAVSDVSERVCFVAGECGKTAGKPR